MDETFITSQARCEPIAPERHKAMDTIQIEQHVDLLEPMEADKALSIMCHTYDRKWQGVIYTIEDIRYPDFNGKQILRTLEQGEYNYQWIEGK